MSNAWQKTGRFSAWALVAVLGLVGLVLILLQTPFAKDRIRQEIIRRANDALQGRVQADRLGGTLLWSASLERVEVYDKEDELVAHIGEVRADYSLLSLVWGRFDIDRVTIDRPRILLRRYEDGTLNVSTIAAPSEEEPPPPEEPSGFELTVASYAVTGGRVIWEDRPTLAERAGAAEGAGPIDFERLGDEIDLALRGRLDPEDPDPTDALRAFMQRRAAEPTAPPGFVLADGLSLDGNLTLGGGGDIRAKLSQLGFDLRTNTLEESLAGEFSGLEVHYGEAGVDATLASLRLGGLALDDVESMVGFGGEDGGLGPLYARIGELRAEASLLRTFLPDIPIQTDITASASAAGSLDRLHARAGVDLGEGGAVDLGAHLDLTGEEPAYRADLRIQGLKPSRIADLGQPPSTIEGAVALRGRGTTLETAEGSLRSALWSTSVANVDIERLAAGVELRDGRATLTGLNLDSSHLEAEARGFVERDGTFDLEAATRTPDRAIDTDQLGLGDLPSIDIGRADIDIDAEGELDFQAATPLQMARRVDVIANWNIAGVDLLGVRLQSSDGDVDVNVVESEGREGRRELILDARASAAGLRLPGLQLDRGEVRLLGDGAIDIGSEDPFRTIEQLSSEYTLRLQGLRAGGASVGQTTLSGRIDRGDGPGRMAATLGGSAGQVVAGGVRLAELETRLDASVHLARDAPLYPVAEVGLKGSLNLEELTHSAASARAIDVTIDLEGPPLDPTGRVGTEATDVEVAGQRFRRVDLGIDTKPDRSIQLDLSATPRAEGARDYEFLVATTYTRDFDAFDIRALRLGRTGQTWDLEEPTRLSFGGGAVTVDSFDLRSGAQRIFLDGTYRSTGQQSVTLDIDALDLGELQRLVDYRPISNLDGKLGLRVDLKGTADRPVVDLNFTADEVSALSYGPITASIEAGSKGKSVDLRRLTATIFGQPLLEASASVPLSWNLAGQTDLSTSRSIRADLDIQPLSFTELRKNIAPIESLPMTGQIAGAFDLRGSLDKPVVDLNLEVADVSVHGEIAGMRLDVDQVASTTTLHYGQPTKEQQRIEFSSELTWAEARLIGASLRTDARLVELGLSYTDGTISLIDLLDTLSREPLEAKVSLRKLNFAELPLGIFKDADAEGRLTGDVDFRGTLLEPTVSVDIGLAEFGWNQYRDIYIDIVADLTDGLLKLDKLRFEWDAEEILMAYGEIPMPLKAIVEGRSLQNLPIDFTLDIKPTSLTKLGAVNYAFNRFQGDFSGYIRAQGTLEAPQFESRFALNNALFARNHRGSIGVWLQADRDNAAGGAMFCQDDLPILTAQFDVPTNLNLVELAAGQRPLADGRITASLKGKNVPIKQLVPTAFVDDYIDDVTGYLNIDMTLEGPWDNLRADGRLAMEEGGITLVEYGRRFRDIKFATAIDEKKIDLESFHMRDSNGTVDADGVVTLAGYIPSTVDLNVETEEFDAGSLSAGFPALVSSKMGIEGSIGDRSEVDIDVSALNVELPESEQSGSLPTDLSEDIVVINKYDRRDSTNQVDDFLSKGATAPGVLRANIDVKIDRDSFVRHPNGYLNFAADIQADILGNRILLSGQVDSVRGEFEFLGRDFNVDRKEGIVRFTGSSPPNPKLDVVAIHPLDRSVVADLESSVRKNPQIFVRVTGSAYEPKLDLTSEPTMSESEIIFVLMTGRPPSKADVGQEEGVASQAAAAAGGIFAALIQQKISKTLPVDVFRFESGEGGLAGSQLRVGKYITSDLFISYAYKFGADEEDSGYEARVEYHFLPQWMVEARYGENQTGELNVFWDIY